MISSQYLARQPRPRSKNKIRKIQKIQDFDLQVYWSLSVSNESYTLLHERSDVEVVGVPALRQRRGMHGGH
jgi:hypothetical protein